MSAAGRSDESRPGGHMSSDIVPAELHRAVQSVACLSGVLFLLPLSLLVSRPPSMTEACGWAGDTLDSRCAIALALLWFSLVASVGQLVMLSAAHSADRFTRRLWWHLPAIVLSTLVGGAIGMHALGLYLALLRGNCEAEWHGPHIILIAAVAAGYIIFIVYACVLRIEWKSAWSTVSPAPKYVDDLEEPLDSHRQGVQPVVLSVIPPGEAPSRDELKLFNVKSGEQSSCRSSRELSTALPSVAPSDRGGDSGNNSNGSSSKSGGQNSTGTGNSPTQWSSATGVTGTVYEEVAEARGSPRKDESRPHSPTLQVGSEALTPVYASHADSSRSGSKKSGSVEQPALSSFAAAKRDGKVSHPGEDGHKRKSSSGGGRRGSGGSRRSSRGSRRTSAEGHRRTSGSSRRTSQEGGWKPPATTPADPTEQLAGSIQYALAERRFSLNNFPEEEKSSRKSSDSAKSHHSALTDVTEVAKAPKLEPPAELLSLSSGDESDDTKRKKKKLQKGKDPAKSRPQSISSAQTALPSAPSSKKAETLAESEPIFHGANPINFDSLQIAQDSDSNGSDGSESKSDCASDETETWNTGGGASAKVEVPIWLLEKLQARGWEPPEEKVQAASSKKTPEPINTESANSRPSKSSRFASCPDLDNEAESPRQFKTANSHPPGTAASSLSTFWKIPMPTRKNTMMIHEQPGSKGKKMLDPEAEEDEEEDEEGDEGVHSDESGNEWKVGLVNADGREEDLMANRKAASGPSSQRSSVCSNQSVKTDGGILKSNAWNGKGKKAAKQHLSMSQRKISFMDQELGHSFEKYSEEKKTRQPELTVIGEHADPKAYKINISNWKNKGRSRANSVSHMSTVQETPTVKVAPASDTDTGTGSQGLTGTESSTSGESLTVPGGRRSRRPSLLAIFSDDNAKSPGLYAVPKEKEESSSELVEIRRGSLVMSSSMLTDILKSKADFGSDRLEEIDEGNRGEEVTDAEVILPFFSQAQQHIRNCQCQTDPETGCVIHTCMTPSATQTTNSVFQSYICSEWGTRRNSADKEARRAKSRKSSDVEQSDSDEDDEVEVEPPPPIEHPRPPSRKRIRNASVLAIATRPQAATKTEVDEEPAQENELAISFKNIQSVEDSCLSDSSPQTPEKRHHHQRSPSVQNTDAKSATGEARVETELTHKFELLEPYIMAGMLKDHNAREQVLVVDVRGRDWIGGHIPSSINLRTSEVVAHPEALLSQCRQNRITHLVFTCMYSVLRARKCAVAVEKAQVDHLKAGHQAPKIRLSLLAGGMHAWVNHFMKSQTDKPPRIYLDGFDKEMWSDGGPSQGGLVHVMDALWSSGGQKALSDALTQELEQLVLMRRNSQEHSRRQSGSSTRRNSEDEKADKADVPSLKVEDLPEGRPLSLDLPPGLPLEGILEESASCYSSARSGPEH